MAVSNAKFSLVLIVDANKPRRDKLLRELVAQRELENCLYISARNPEEARFILRDFDEMLGHAVYVGKEAYPGGQKDYSLLNGRRVIVVSESPDDLERARTDGYCDGVLICDENIPIKSIKEKLTR